MNSTSQILVDSAAFVAWFFEKDTFHQAALERFEWITQQHLTPVATSAIVDETATVLNHREGQTLARNFLDFIMDMPLIFITEELRKETLSLFREQNERGTSIVDCSNVVVMKRFSIATIFSYDDVFSDTFHLHVVQ